MKRWQLVPLLAIGACDPSAGFAGERDASTPRIAITADAAAGCTRPEEGCPCGDGAGPIDCYLDPEDDPSGGLVCHAGTQSCRDGAWTACETVRSFRIEPTSTSLVTGPDACNPCNPRCFVSRDVPTPADLTASSSAGVSYDPTSGGITITMSAAPTAPALIDGDGDGIPDVADDCVGPGFYRHPDGSCTGGIHHVLAFGASAPDPISARVEIRSADVYFLVDTTSSMAGELARLRAELTTGSLVAGCSGGILGAVRCAIPDAWFGVGAHDDYPVDPHGGAGDAALRHALDVQSSTAAAQSAVDALAIHWGNDGPDAQTQALWSIATGGALGSYASARTGCAAGRWGYPCFRPGTLPIVVLVTDAPFHNGPSGAYPYCIGCTTITLPLPMASAVSANERMDASAHGPVDLTGAWVGLSGDTTSMADDVAIGCGEGAPDAVFRVRLTTAQTTRFTTEGSAYDTVLGVFPVSGAGWCDDDGGLGSTSLIERALPAGDYWVVVDGRSTGGGRRGAYRLSMGTPYTATGYTGASWTDATSALASRGIRTITVQTCGDATDPYCVQGEQHARDLGNATGALGSSGAPLVVRAAADGAGLGVAIASAIDDVAGGTRMDVSARVVGDAQGFTRLPITASAWSGGGCTGIGSGVFTQCLPGTTVEFTATFRNDVVPPTASPQVFTFFVEVVGGGTVVLARVPVRIVVPASPASMASTGSYRRDHDATVRCGAGELPYWGELAWAATTPPGTRVELELRAATTAAGLASASRVGRAIAPTTAPPIDLGAALRAAGYPDGMPFLRVTAVLYANAARTVSPTLTSVDVTYTCMPAF